ncbi:hypothetical protein ACN47E_004859 [Coniothyrium glycines]
MQKKVIIALSTTLGIFTLVVMALVTRFLVQRHNKYDTNKDVHITDGTLESQRRLIGISSSWKRLFGAKREQPGVRTLPSVNSILRAGDEGQYSCKIFSDLRDHAEDITIDSMNILLANGPRFTSTAGCSAHPEDFAKYPSETKRGTSGIGRVRSMSHRRTRSQPADISFEAIKKKSMDMSLAEKGVSRSFSTKRLAPVLIHVRNGFEGNGTQAVRPQTFAEDSQPVEYVNGKASVRMNAKELAALSIISGQTLELISAPTASSETAFNLSLRVQHSNNIESQISFQKHKGSISQMPARGSGSSPLFAKHVATGALPFSSDGTTVDSILLDESTFEAIQAGASLYLKPSKTQTEQSQYLASLPSSRNQRFHILATSTEPHPLSTLTDAIAALPFSGGLAPIASTCLIRTVQFIASANLPLGRLLQRLEGLVDKVQRLSPQLDIFGPLYHHQNAGLLFREQGRLGRISRKPDMTDTLPDKTARMSRYITLLERLMALVPDIKSEDVLEAVLEATKNEVHQSYMQAVAGNPAPKPYLKTPWSVTSRELDVDSTPNKRNSVASTSRSARTSYSSPGTSVERGANLGEQLEQVLKMDLPFSVETLAFVARMVIVAWTSSVRQVAWEQGEAGVRLPRFEDFPEKMVLC